MKKTSPSQAVDFRSIGLQGLTAIILALAMMTLSMAPALADRDRKYDRGDRHGKQSQQHWRAGHDGNRQVYRQPMHRQPYYYAQPVYVPPPVYYEPQQSPGISLFFPLDLRR